MSLRVEKDPHLRYEDRERSLLEGFEYTKGPTGKIHFWISPEQTLGDLLPAIRRVFVLSGKERGEYTYGYKPK